MTTLRATALFASFVVIACKPGSSGDEVADPDTATAESDTESGSESDESDDTSTTTTDDEDSTSTTQSSETGEELGELIGQFVLTYYWFLFEDDYEGDDSTILRDSNCSAIANVPESFAADVCIEGSGKLTSGEIINVDGTCDCGYSCNGGSTLCFVLLDPVEFPWGAGSSDNPLEPLRSWAVDEAVIPHGTIVYAPDWDGMEIPAIDGLGGFTHDGCFRADDVGGGIDGFHVDFFAGTTSMWESLEAMFPSLEQQFAVYQNSPECAGFGG
jgi:3D (Asp-Asp-Asp) domain-containing protein